MQVGTLQIAKEETKGNLPHSRHDVQKNHNLDEEYESPEFLPLLPWEVRAIEERICSPDTGIPQSCCPGAISHGGLQKWSDEYCEKNVEIYVKAQDYAIQYMQTNYPKEEQGICDICKIIEHLFQHNLTLSFVGDSVTAQTISGLECGLARRGYNVTFKDVTVQMDKKNLTVEEKLCAGWRYCVSTKLQFTILSREGQAAIIQFYMHYRPDPSNIELKKEILPNSDIVVFDNGLHYTPNEHHGYLTEMTDYLHGFAGSNLTLLAWRETSSQHFNSEGGHYPPIDGNLSSCKSIESGHDGFRLPIMQKAADNAGFIWKKLTDGSFKKEPPKPNELVFIPFREYTLPLHYMHGTECTHYCYSPHLWLPIWRDLRIAMDRAIQ